MPGERSCEFMSDPREDLTLLVRQLALSTLLVAEDMRLVDEGEATGPMAFSYIPVMGGDDLIPVPWEDVIEHLLANQEFVALTLAQMDAEALERDL